MVNTDEARYVAHAERDGKWWVLTIEVPEVDRTLGTQVKRLDQGQEMVADLIAVVTGNEASDYLGRIDIVPELSEQVRNEVDCARNLRAEIERQMSKIVEVNRAAARHLAAMELSHRDIGTILGLTHQRVSQLLADVGEKTGGARRAAG